MEHEAADEDDRKAPETEGPRAGPVAGGPKVSWTVVEQVLGEGGGVGTGVLQSEVTEGAQHGQTEGSYQSKRN